MSLLSGVESGLATTTAIVAGLAISTDRRHVVVVTAIISLSVQAWNSAMITIFSEHTQSQIDHPYSIKDHYLLFINDGLAQFLAHILASFIPILPIVFVSDLSTALISSVLITILLLFVLGYKNGRILKRGAFKTGLEAMVPGALVIMVGVVAGLALI